MAFAALTIDLNARLANIEAGLDKAVHLAERRAQTIQNAFGKLSGALSVLGGAAAVGGVASLAKSAIDTADNLAKLSQKIGISVEDLSGYRVAADLSGLSLEQFSTGVAKLAKNVAEGSDDLKALGITSRDINQVLPALAETFARMPDGAEKTALAMRLMGRAGAEMIPLLNGGGEALRRMLEQGRELAPITTEMAKASEEFNDSLTRLKTSASNLGFALAKHVLPPLNEMLSNIEHAQSLGRKGFGFGELIGMGVNPTQQPGEQLKTVREELRKLQEDQQTAESLGFGRYESIDNQIARLRELKSVLEAIQREQALGVLDKVLKSGSQPGVDGLQSALAGTQEALKKAFDIKPMEDYLKRLQGNRAKIIEEYARLKAGLDLGPAPENAQGTDVQQALIKARGSIAGGDQAGAQAQLDRAKELLSQAAKNGEAGFVTNYLADQLRAFELQLADQSIKAAQQARDTLQQSLAQQQAAALKLNLDVDDAKKQADAFIASVQAQLDANPLRFTVGGQPKVYADGGLGVALDIGSASLQRGARQ